MVSLLESSSCIFSALSTVGETGERGHNESFTGSESFHSEMTQITSALIW